MIYFLFLSFITFTYGINEIPKSLECQGKRFDNVTLTAYYPNYDEENSDEKYLDRNGKDLRTLQDYLDDRTKFVTIAMDANLHLPYGAVVCCPELNKHFGRRIILQVRDNGSDLENQGYTRADICVRTEADSYDHMVNDIVTFFI